MRRLRTRSLTSGICLMAALTFAASPVVAADPEPPVSRGPHPSPPTGKELERLVALNDHPPVDELAGDITALVVTHTVSVKIATDEEWRAYYGSNAFIRANNAIEAADDAMFAQFGVDLYWYQSVNWHSDPDSGNVDACDLLDDLKADRNPGQSDILVGFAKNYSNNYAGCSEVNGDEAEVNWNSSSYNRWVTTQHEVSHLFSLPDRYPDPYDSHTDDVMEQQFENPDFWCSWYQGGYGASDSGIFTSKAGKFD